ncbi:MAG: hypothetical protein OXG42_00605 [Chloroflexi bacterium]|nr:hypothetical protein [Chloroflexota bacterium]
MKLTKIALAILALSAATLVACATPRERSEPLTQPEPSVERRSAPIAEVQQQSELANLTTDAQRDAPAVTAPESFQMSGSGDAQVEHELAAGLYRCSIDLQGNVQGEQPAPFRIHFVSREPLNPALVDTTQSVWSTNFDLFLAGSAQTATSLVDVRLQAAPASEWSLKCDRRAELGRADRGSRSTIQLTVTLNDEPRGNLSSSSGRGSGTAMISAIPDVYTCRIDVTGNFADDGGETQFKVALRELTLVDVSAATWSGEVEYELTGEHGIGITPTLSITAGESASWGIVCLPKPS